jgi:hypothetical protein
MTTATDSTQEMMPEFVDEPLGVYQKAQMALTLAALFCQERSLPLIQDNGKPSAQVAAVATALLG